MMTSLILAADVHWPTSLFDEVSLLIQHATEEDDANVGDTQRSSSASGTASDGMASSGA
jgi:hypothetical protein